MFRKQKSLGRTKGPETSGVDPSPPGTGTGQASLAGLQHLAAWVLVFFGHRVGWVAGGVTSLLWTTGSFVDGEASTKVVQSLHRAD